MAKQKIHTLTGTIEGMHQFHGPVIIKGNASVMPNTVLKVNKGGIWIGPDEQGNLPTIWNNVTIVSEGVFDPFLRSLQDMPRETLRDMRERREAISEHFRQKGIGYVPFGGIKFAPEILLGNALKLTQVGHSSSAAFIECYGPAEHLRVKTQGEFRGGDLISPTIEAFTVQVGTVKGGKITSENYIHLHSAGYNAQLNAGTVILAARLENVRATAGSKITYGFKSDRAVLNAPEIEMQDDANPPTPKDHS